MTFQPFPIADFDTGLFQAREPWISPRNAFRTLRNGRIYLGRLEKRRGYSRHSDVGIQASQVNGSINNGVANIDYFPSPTSRAIVPESVELAYTDGGANNLTAEVNKNTEEFFESTGIWRWPVYETGTTTRLGWAYRDNVAGNSHVQCDWTLHSSFASAGGSLGTMDYWYNPENAIVGLADFRDSSGEYSLAIDEDSVYLYDTSDGFYKQQTTANVFTGDADDYFWTWPLDSYIVMTNGVDAVHKYTPGAGTPVAEMPTNFDGSAGNDIDTALLVVRLGGRLIYLHTTESSTRYPRRARWTTAGSFETFDSANDFADAPANLGDIVTAGLIGERMFVGFQKGWMELVSTGDSVSPIEWRPLISRYGAASKLSTIPDNERLLTRAPTQMQAVDPNGQYDIDNVIPDLALGFNPNKTNLSAGVRNDEKRAFWWTYVAPVDSQPGNVLVAQYNEKSELAWSVYDMDFQVFSTFANETNPTWDSFPGTWDDYTEIGWDSAAITEGFPQLIGGTRFGLVHVFDESNRDYGAEIAFEAETIELSPYPGQRAHLGFLDIYGTASQGVTLTVSLWADTNGGVYKSQPLDMSPSMASGKVYRRLRVNRIAAFHRIKLEATGAVWFAVDAIVPWFQPAGPIREFG